jgi:hypothetical protein
MKEGTNNLTTTDSIDLEAIYMFSTLILDIK